MPASVWTTKKKKQILRKIKKETLISIYINKD